MRILLIMLAICILLSASAYAASVKVVLEVSQQETGVLGNKSLDGREMDTRKLAVWIFAGLSGLVAAALVWRR